MASNASQANELDPKYAYYALWLDIIEQRGNLASQLAQTAPQVNMTKWPAPDGARPQFGAS